MQRCTGIKAVSLLLPDSTREKRPNKICLILLSLLLKKFLNTWDHPTKPRSEGPTLRASLISTCNQSKALQRAALLSKISPSLLVPISHHRYRGCPQKVIVLLIQMEVIQVPGFRVPALLSGAEHNYTPGLHTNAAAQQGLPYCNAFLKHLNQ